MNKKIIASIVGFAIILAIGISIFTGQKDTFAWFTNDNYVEDDFWNNDRTPGNDAQIVSALFGDGNGNTDPTFYTRNWTSNTCNTPAMSVQYIPAGTDNIPSTLTGNTIYVLGTGAHNMTSTRVFSGDCIGLVGRRYTVTNGTGIATVSITGSAAFTLSGNKNIIIFDINASVSSTAVGIQAQNISSSTIAPAMGGAIAGVLGEFVNPTNITLFNGWNGGYNANQTNLYISGGQDVRIGEPRPIIVSRRSQTGIAVYNTDNIIMYADAANNIGIGSYFENVNNLEIYGRYHVNNTSHALVVSGSSNVYIQGGAFGGDYINNGGNGVYLYNVNSGTLQNVVATDNIINGMRVEKSTDITITGSTSNSNQSAGIYIHDYSSNILLTNTKTSLNDDNGVHFYVSSGFVVSNHISSGNVEDGILIEGSFSGFVTSGVMYENSAGVNIIGGSAKIFLIKSSWTRKATTTASLRWNTTSW